MDPARGNTANDFNGNRWQRFLSWSVPFRLQEYFARRPPVEMIFSVFIVALSYFLETLFTAHLKPLAFLVFYPALFVVSCLVRARASIVALLLSVGIIWVGLMRGSVDATVYAIAHSFLYFVTGSMFIWFNSAFRVTHDRVRRLELDAHQETLVGLLDNLPALVFVKDSKSRFLFANRLMRDEWALGPEFIGSSDFELYPQDPEVASEARQFDEVVRRTEKPLQRERSLFRNGKMCTYYTVKFPICWADNRGAICGIAIDITKQKEAEEVMRTIAENATSCLYLHNEKGYVTYMNPAAEAVTGFRLSELADRPFHNHLHPHPVDAVDLAGKPCPVGELHNNGTPVREKEDVFYRKDGTPFPVSYSIAPLKWGSAIRGSVLEFRDITEKKRAEGALRRVRDRLALAIEAAGLGVWEWDIVSDNLAWSVTLQQQFGYPPENFSGTYDAFMSRIHPDDKIEVRRRHRYAVEMRRDFNMEYRVVWPDGQMRWISANGRTHHDSEGKPVWMAGTTLDITEQRLVQSRLKAQAQELERSNQELARFAYVASHDLKEPLRVVTSYIQMFQKRYSHNLDPVSIKYMGFITHGIDRMYRLINSLLNYSGVGSSLPVPQRVDLNELVEEVTTNLGKALQESGARIDREWLPTVNADPSHMLQLFQNLLSNAIKYRAEEPPRICLRYSESGGQPTFAVSDNGIGIEPVNFKRIFVMFQRLHQGGRYSGTGIGLAICQKIIDQLGGKIWIESALGKGSTFYFTMPAVFVNKGEAHGKRQAV